MSIDERFIDEQLNADIWRRIIQARHEREREIARVVIEEIERVRQNDRELNRPNRHDRRRDAALQKRGRA